MGNGANIGKGVNKATPDGMRPLADNNKSFSMINGELPIMVRPLPKIMADAIGISRRESTMPVRADKREATGKNRAVTDGFCINPEIKPAAAELNKIRRSSMPSERLNNQAAKRFKAPVRSRPELNIIEAIMLITALLESPENNSPEGTKLLAPKIISTTSAVRSPRIRSNTNIVITKAAKPSTKTMSPVSGVMLLSMCANKSP